MDNKGNKNVYYTHFEITGGPCNLIGSNWCDLFTNRTIYKSNQSSCKIMKDKEYRMANFATFVSKTLTFPLQKWMNLISNQLSTASIKYLNWPSPVFERFKNGCDKVVIELRVVQFWSKIILVTSNRTRTACPFNFEITHIISAEIALHSVQLPL